MSKTYEGPGRARKLCPNCQKYIHVKNRVCPNCEHSFNKEKKEKKVKVITPTERFYTKSKLTKECKICGKYSPRTSTHCVACGVEFPKKAFDPSTIKTYSEVGMGKKKCVECGTIVGVRVPQCPKCNRVFVRGETSKSKMEKQIDQWDDYDKEFMDKYAQALLSQLKALGYDCENISVVLAPAGDSPVTLMLDKDKITEDNVFDFCDGCVVMGHKEKKLYSPRAIKCFGRHFLSANSLQYKYFVNLVDKWAENLVGDK